MHNHFIVKTIGDSVIGQKDKSAFIREKQGELIFNTVNSAYAAQFLSAEKAVDKILLDYTENGTAKQISKNAKVSSTRTISDSMLEVSFSAEFSFNSSVELESLSLVSSNGVKINEAQAGDGVSLGKDTEVTCVVYFTFNSSVNACKEGLCDLVLHLLGVRKAELTACVVNGLSEYSSQLFSVTKEIGSEYVSLKTTLEEQVDGEYFVLRANGFPALYKKAEKNTVNTVNLTSIGNVLPITRGAKEISVIADGAVKKSDVFVRRVASKTLDRVSVLRPFAAKNKCAVSKDGKYLAIAHADGLTLFVKDEAYRAVNVFSNLLYGKQYKALAYSGNKLFAIENGMIVFNADTGEKICEYSMPIAAEEVFACGENKVILCGNDGFCVCNVQTEVVADYLVNLSGAKYAYDELTKTLSVFTASGVYQYSIGSESYEVKQYVTEIDLSSLVSVGGRCGRAFITMENGVEIFDTQSSTRTYKNFPMAEGVYASKDGVYFCVAQGDEVGVYRYDNGFVSIGSATGRILSVDSCGVLTEDGFFPFADLQNRFEIAVCPSGGTYTVYVEVPYFEAEPVFFKLKGVV